MQLLGRQEGGVAGDEADRDLGQRIVQPTADLTDHEPDSETERHPAHPGDDEAGARVEQRERSADGSRHGGSVGHERGGIVDEALALDQVDDAARCAETAHDRRRRHRVGR